MLHFGGKNRQICRLSAIVGDQFILKQWKSINVIEKKIIITKALSEWHHAIYNKHGCAASVAAIEFKKHEMQEKYAKNLQSLKNVLN